MTTRSATIQARLATVPDAVGISPRTVVAIPPSDADVEPGYMRVAANGSIVLRPFDDDSGGGA